MARNNFYRFVEQHHQRPLRILQGELHGSDMVTLQHIIYRRLYRLPPDTSSPFVSTVKSVMRTVTNLRQDPNNLVDKVLRNIDNIKHKNDIVDVLKLLHEGGVPVLFKVDYEPDVTCPRKQIVRLTVEDALTGNYEAKQAKAYQKALCQHFQLKTPKTSPHTLEQELAPYRPSVAQLLNPHFTHNPVDVNNVSGNLVWLKWYFEGTGATQVTLDDLGYFEALGRAMGFMKLSRWQAYLQFAWLQHVDAWFSDTWMIFDRILKRPSVELWYHKTSVAARAWWQDAGQQYVDSAKSELTVRRFEVQDMLMNIRQVLSGHITSSAWQAQTKDAMQDKLDSMVMLAGWSDEPFPPLVTTFDPDDAMLESFGVSETKMAYFDQFVCLGHMQQYANIFSEAAQPTDREQWKNMSYAEVNACYARDSNTLYIPAALFNPPFLTSSLAETYGALGSILAHEMFHAFDYDSLSIGADLKLANWSDWFTPRDFQEYKSNVDKVLRLYGSKHSITGRSASEKTTSIRDNSRQTLSENIADYEALRLAYDALEAKIQSAADRTTSPLEEHAFFTEFARSQVEKYTPSTQKYMESNDEHANAMARVNLPLASFPPFHRFYEVQPKDKMYIQPSERPHFM